MHVPSVVCPMRGRQSTEWFTVLAYQQICVGQLETIVRYYIIIIVHDRLILQASLEKNGVTIEFKTLDT